MHATPNSTPGSPLPTFLYRSAATSDAAPLPLREYGGAFNVSAAGVHPEDHGTSHISVVDADRCGGGGLLLGVSGCSAVAGRARPLVAAAPTPLPPPSPAGATAPHAARMAVSLTTTINTGFGSKVVSPSTGALEGAVGAGGELH